MPSALHITSFQLSSFSVPSVFHIDSSQLGSFSVPSALHTFSSALVSFSLPAALRSGLRALVPAMAVAALVACESAADVYAELQPLAALRLQQIEVARQIVRDAPEPSGTIVLSTDAPPPRFCSAVICRSDRPPNDNINARVVQLDDLESLGRFHEGGPVPVARRMPWLNYGAALARSTLDPSGRPLQAWHGPTLREMMQRFVDVRYMLVFRSSSHLDAWVQLERPRAGLLLSLAVEAPEADGDTGAPAPISVEGALDGAAFLVDLTAGRILGGISFHASDQDRAAPYRAIDELILRTDLARTARRQVRLSLASVLGRDRLPFAPSGDLVR